MRYLILLVMCCVLTGCSGDPIKQKLTALNKENYQKASTMYVIYASMNNYRGPASLEEMIDFLSTNDRAIKRLNLVGMDPGSLNDYAIGRDGEPFKFRWSVRSSPMAPPYPICFEQTGVDGVRQVAFSGKKMVEVTDDKEYERLLAGKIRKDEIVEFVPGIQTTEENEE